MKHEIVKTILHFTDDKGWKHEIECEGEHGQLGVYRMVKRASMRDATELVNTAEPPAMPHMNYYEFHFYKQTFERIALHYFIKHLFYEMI